MDDQRLLALASAVDAVVVACFPWKLPPALLARPRLGGLNVHPSLLPLGRGPEPVFWTLRRGERRTGATIHRLDGRVGHRPRSWPSAPSTCQWASAARHWSAT
jgi:methionyl-tRNA formyltransferase